jgi:hypothetical protein
MKLQILWAAVIEMTEQDLISRVLQVSVHHIQYIYHILVVVNALRALWIKNPSDLGTSRIGNPGVIEEFEMVFIFCGFIECLYVTSRGHPWHPDAFERLFWTPKKNWIVNGTSSHFNCFQIFHFTSNIPVLVTPTVIFSLSHSVSLQKISNTPMLDFSLSCLC